jgi:PAS domain S-box-containing protein
MGSADTNIKNVRENLSKTEEDLELQRLREIEKKYNSLFETILLGVVYQDINGKIISANHAAEEILGLSYDQMQGRTSTDPRWKSIHEDGSDFLGDTHPAMIALKTGKKVENAIMGVFDPKKEEIRWININATPIYKKGETKPFQVYTIFEDITERKRNEEHVDFERRQLETILETMHSAVVLVESDGHFSFLNKRAMELYGIDYLGYDLDSHIAKVNAKKLDGTPFPLEEMPVSYSLKFGEKVQGVEMIIERNDGKQIPVTVNSAPIFDAEGKITTAIVIFQDIVEQKKNNRKLKESEEKFSKAFYSNTAGMLISTDSKIVEVNEAYANITGYTREELLYKTAVSLNIFSEENREYIVKRLYDKGIIHNEEFEIRTKTGEKRPVLYTSDFIEINGKKSIFTIVYDITKRKKSEEKTNRILDNIAESYFEFDNEWRYVDVNIKSQEILGLKKEELVGKVMWELLPQLIGSKQYEEFHKAKKENIPVRFETKSVVTGEWFETNAYPHPEGLSAYSHNINDRKKVEEYNQKLLENEQQLTEELQASNEELQSTTEELYKSNDELRQYSEMLSTIYELNPDAIALSTVSDSKIIDCNQEYLNQIGYSREETIGHTSEELDLIFDIAHNAYIDETRGKDRVSNFEGKIRRKDGSLIDVLYSARQVTINNEIVLLSIGHDVTESRRVEKSLRESEERFRTLADNIPNLAWMADANGWIFWYNKQWYEYTGSTFEEMQGWGWQKVHHPDYVDSVTEEWSTKILDGEPYDNTFPLKGKDGNYRWFLTRITPIRDEYGKVQRWFGTNTDVTERKVIEDNLQTTMDELKQSNKELEQFAYITSHDLREPLRMITSFLQLLERRYKDQLDQDADEFIGFAVNGAKRLDTMTNDLLQYSKITNKNREAIPVNFEHVLEHALANLKVQIEENNAIITHDPLPTIVGDEELKVQLFQNIIGNAIKYKSQEIPKIHISAIKEKNQYLFSIKDNGIGMSSKHLEKIFTIFQRLHTNEEYEGTGIGLAIAQKIVHQQGGQIWAESELGKGTTFYFTIPFKE